jgi:GNAT superfamily N-acetyltransferase
VRLFFSALNDQHDRAGFSSGVPDLDNYFKANAGQDARRNLSSVFVLSGEDKTEIIGYYTLSQHSLTADEFPVNVSKKLPQKRKVACTLLGRLAVDWHYQRLGYGRVLLFHALKKTIAVSKDIASFAVIVDAKNENAKRFYQKYDFENLDDAPLRLFITVKGLEQKLKLSGKPMVRCGR